MNDSPVIVPQEKVSRLFLRWVSAAAVLFAVCLPGSEGGEKDRKGPLRPEEAAKLLKELEVEVLLVTPPTATGEGLKSNKLPPSTLTAGDADAIARECRPAVKFAAPVVRARTKVTHKDRSHVPLLIYGTTPAFLDVRSQTVQRGRRFTDKEAKARARVCLLGRTLAGELFGKEDPLNKTVRLSDQPFKVVGLLTARGANAMGLDRDDILVAPWTTIKPPVSGGFNPVGGDFYARADGLALVDQILVRVSGEDAIPGATKKVAALLRRRHRIARGGRDDFDVRDWGEIAKKLRRLAKQK